MAGNVRLQKHSRRKEGNETMRRVFKKIDSDKVRDIMNEKKLTNTNVAHKTGRTDATISRWILRGEVPEVAFHIFCEALNCDEADISPTPTAEQLTQCDHEQLNRIEIAISTIRNDIQVLKEFITPDILTNKDRAVLTLKQMMGDSGRVEEHDYVSKCNEMGIDEHSRKFAIEKIDAYTQTLGYGKNAKRVIFKRARQYE